MFILKENDVVKKYQIKIDKEKLNNLRCLIIENCSFIEHVKARFEEDYIPNDNSIYIRNFSKRFLSRESNRDFFGPTFIDIYEVEYDYYNQPDIIDLIDDILGNNEDACIRLLKYPCKEKKDYKKEINDLLDDKENIDKNIKEITRLLEQEKNNKNQKDVSIYLNDIKSCVTLILVDEYSYNDYLKFCKFCDMDEKIMSTDNLIYEYYLHKN